MSLSRRSFVQTLGAGAAGAWVGGRGREAGMFGLEALDAAEQNAAGPRIILSSNENPNGPGKAVLDAVRGVFTNTGRYPNDRVDEIAEMIARKHGVKPENVLVGSGSTQLLRTITHVFCSKTAGLVAAIPAYEECAGYAQLMGYPVTGVKLNSELKMDLDALLGASKGAGMAFYCNPNNPVATAIGGKATRDYIAAVNKSSPNTTILVDEAYFEYATMPGYETMIPLAVTNPRVVVARTFSKAYGMAGLRVGYAVGHKDSIRKMADWDGISAVNTLGVAAVRAALQLDPAVLAAESKRNTEARAFTMKWFTDRGYKPTDSQTNFIFVDIKRPAAQFRAACAAENVIVGRNFPPYEKSHARISIGTMAEMQRAVQTFERALATKTAAA
ncbi:MAG: histidinol-phosphate transaminase [Acidobacteriota bacterium]|nr:histidinol-phosphate transaminase [Acidobacteriota bacterium]